MRLDCPGVEWWVVTRRDNGYPLLVYPDRKTAEEVAQVNGERFVKVVVKEQKE